MQQIRAFAGQQERLFMRASRDLRQRDRLGPAAGAHMAAIALRLPRDPTERVHLDGLAEGVGSGRRRDLLQR